MHLVSNFPEKVITEDFKYLITPLLANSLAEQELVYYHWEKLLNRAFQNSKEEHTPIPWWEQFASNVRAYFVDNKWIVYLLGLAFILIFSRWLIGKLIPPIVDECFCWTEISTIQTPYIDSTLKFELSASQLNNQQLADRKPCFPVYISSRLGDEIVKQDTIREKNHWLFTVPPIPTNGNNLLTITAHYGDSNHCDTLNSIGTPTVVKCLSPPSVSINAPLGELAISQSYVFQDTLLDRDQLQLTWYSNGVEIGQSDSISHTFNQRGTYTLELVGKDTSQNTRGTYCQSRISKKILVGSSKLAPLEAYLSKDFPLLATPKTPKPKVSAWLCFLLLLFASMSILWLWWRKRKQSRNFELGLSQEQRKEFDHLFASPDAPPYWLEFVAQDKDEYIQVHKLDEFSSFLRRRQHNEVEQIDISATIDKTLQQAGYLDIQYRNQSNPSDYLFLIDIEASHSHMAELFKFLARQLKGQDVYGDIFFYQTHPGVLWNHNHQTGLSLEQLLRKFGKRRLLIFGNSYGLLDDYEADHPQKARGAIALFKEWQQRLIITPTPISSWTYKEARLYRYFGIFPADMEGMLRAVNYMAEGADEETLSPTLKDWMNSFTSQSTDRFTDRAWETLDDHFRFLESPGLCNWFAALAVEPTPNWVTTIAIGLALEDLSAPHDLKVNYESLLLLSRIPMLRDGQIPDSLLAEMLDYLKSSADPEIELAAREGVLYELKNITKDHATGYANTALQTGIAFHEFALTPDQPLPQRKIAYLLNRGSLTKRELMMLDRAVPAERTEDTKVGQRIKRYLSKQNINQKYYAPLLSSGISFLFISLLALSALLTIDRWFDCEVDETRSSYALLVKCEDEVNSWQTKYNTAIDYYRTNLLDKDWMTDVASDEKTNDIAALIYSSFVEIHDSTRQQLETILQDGDYYNNADQIAAETIIKTTIAKTHFNEGYFNYYLQKHSKSFKKSAQISFQVARDIPSNDTIRMEALHALGLMAHYNEQKDSACLFLNEIRKNHLNLFRERKTIPDLASFVTCKCMVVDVLMKYSISLRNRSLTNSEFYAIQTNPNSRLYTETLIVDVPRGAEVTLIDSNELTYYINYQGQTGYIAKEYANRPTLVPCAERRFVRVVFKDAGTEEPIKEAKILLNDISLELISDENGFASYIYTQTPQTLIEAGVVAFSVKADGYFDMYSDFRLFDNQNNLDTVFLLTKNIDWAYHGSNEGYMWCLDAGHGRLTAGKRSPVLADGTQLFEYKQNRKIVDLIIEQLREYDISHFEVMPETNVDNALLHRIERIELLQSEKTKVLVSVHTTAAPAQSSKSFASSSIKGMETWFAHESIEGKRVAGIFQRNIISETALENRHIKSRPDSQFYIFRKGPNLTILTENGFYNNPTEVYLLRTTEMQQAIANGHVKAILEIEGIAVNPNITPEVKIPQLIDYLPLQFMSPTIPKMQKISGGSFTMGTEWVGLGMDTKPPHQVNLKPFNIGVNEVTIKEYSAYSICEEGTYISGLTDSPKIPITQVSWYDAIKYCNWLSNQFNRAPYYNITGTSVTINPSANGYRLPTEAEWEYAASGRGRHAHWPADLQENEEDRITEYANVCDVNCKESGSEAGGGPRRPNLDDGYAYPSPAGSFYPNALGLYDMAGNVSEWCGNWYDKDSYQKGEHSIPSGVTSGQFKVIRGGSYENAPVSCRFRNRMHALPDSKSNTVGFRLATNAE